MPTFERPFKISSPIKSSHIESSADNRQYVWRGQTTLGTLFKGYIFFLTATTPLLYISLRREAKRGLRMWQPPGHQPKRESPLIENWTWLNWDENCGKTAGPLQSAFLNGPVLAALGVSKTNNDITKYLITLNYAKGLPSGIGNDHFSC